MSEGESQGEEEVMLVVWGRLLYKARCVQNDDFQLQDLEKETQHWCSNAISTVKF